MLHAPVIICLSTMIFLIDDKMKYNKMKKQFYIKEISKITE